MPTFVPDSSDTLGFRHGTTDGQRPDPLNHPWLGRLVPLRTALAQRQAVATHPVAVEKPARSMRRGRLLDHERVEPQWHASGSSTTARTDSALSLLGQFFTVPLLDEAPLAMWWPVGETEGFDSRTPINDLPMAVQDPQVLAWMTQRVGGKTLPMNPEPSFSIDTTDDRWSEVDVPFQVRPHPTVWWPRVGVWCCREKNRLSWGMGAHRWHMDRSTQTLTQMHWNGARGWSYSVSHDRNLYRWMEDLMGRKRLKDHDHGKGWNNEGLPRALYTQTLPNAQQWNDTTPLAWAETVIGLTDNAGTSRSATLLPLNAQEHANPENLKPDGASSWDAPSWQKNGIAHAQEWNLAEMGLQRRWRALARAARRHDPAFAAWSSWAWSYPLRNDTPNPFQALSEGWLHAKAWSTLCQEAGGAAHWVKLRSSYQSSVDWREGHGMSASSLGDGNFVNAWPTQAGQRWARRQRAASVRQWSRLGQGMNEGERSGMVEWGELLARWDVDRLPSWAVQAIGGFDQLRAAASTVLNEELNNLQQPSHEQRLLRNTLRSRQAPDHTPSPSFLRPMLRAWVRDVVARPWSARRDELDPVGGESWRTAFLRYDAVAPEGHERWTWARWEAWVHQDHAWREWLATHPAHHQGWALEHEGWRVVKPLNAHEVGVELSSAAAAPWAVAVSHEDHDLDEPTLKHGDDFDAGDESNAERPFSLELWMEDWVTSAREEVWHVEHTSLGLSTIVLRKARRGWRADLAQTPRHLQALAQRWSMARQALETLTQTVSSASPSRTDSSPSTLTSAWWIEFSAQNKVTPSPSAPTIDDGALPYALGELRFKGWSVRPVLRSDGLQELGERMANCVGNGTYVEPMNQGTCRLFVAHGPYLKMPWLIDLRVDVLASPECDLGWSLRQIEGYHNRRAPTALWDMGRALALLYGAMHPGAHTPIPNATETGQHQESPRSEPLDSALSEEAMGPTPTRIRSFQAIVPSSPPCS